MKVVTKVQQTALEALTVSGQSTLLMSPANKQEHKEYAEKLRNSAKVMIEVNNAKMAKL